MARMTTVAGTGRPSAPVVVMASFAVVFGAYRDRSGVTVTLIERSATRNAAENGDAAT